MHFTLLLTIKNLNNIIKEYFIFILAIHSKNNSLLILRFVSFKEDLLVIVIRIIIVVAIEKRIIRLIEIRVGVFIFKFDFI